MNFGSPANWSLALVVAFGSAKAEAPKYREASIQFTGSVHEMLFADLDQDGLEDLLCAVDDRLDVYLQAPNSGFDTAKPTAILNLGEAVAEVAGRSSIGWDLEPARKQGSRRVLAIVDGRRVVAWVFDGATRRFSPPASVVESAGGVLPRGVRRVRFVRDVDGDGLADLVVPGLGACHVYLQGKSGEFRPGLEIGLEVRLESRLTGDGNLASRVGQSITVPLLDLRDVNGDGLRDLVSETEDLLAVYLAESQGAFPKEPTFSVDIAAVRKRVGEFDPDKLDYSNLSGALAWTYQAELDDANGDGIDDVLLREGGKISVFLGTREGVRLEQPHQILKSAGNVLTAALHDEDEDGTPDLWLARVEAISMADVFLWLVASGSVNFEVFIYRSDGTHFSRRPQRRLSVTLSFPALRSLAKLGEEIERKRKELSGIRAVGASLSPEAESEGLVVFREGRLRGYLRAEGPSSSDPDMLELLGYRRDQDEYSLDLEKLIEKFVLEERSRIVEIAERTPDFEIPVPAPSEGSSTSESSDSSQARDLAALDLNADGVDDIVVLHRVDDSRVEGRILLSRP